MNDFAEDSNSRIARLRETTGFVNPNRRNIGPAVAPLTSSVNNVTPPAKNSSNDRDLLTCGSSVSGNTEPFKANASAIEIPPRMPPYAKKIASFQSDFNPIRENNG